MEVIFDKATKDKIFRVSIDLFSKEGFNAISIRDIAKEVGIKSSSLYNHFKSKDEILDEIFNYFKKTIENTEIIFEDEDIKSLNSKDILKKYIILFGQSLTAEADKIFRILLMEQYRNNKARDFIINDLLHNRTQFFTHLIDKMIQFGKIRNVDSKKYGQIINYAFFSLSIEYNHDKIDKNTNNSIIKVFNFIEIINTILAVE